MSIIRSAHASAFQEAGLRLFEGEMEDHLRAFAPELSRAAGPEGVRAAVRTGVERATAHGFTMRGPVRLYLEMMCSFGSGFDTDPQYPWAAEILGGVNASNEIRIACQLQRSAAEFLAGVSGPAGAFALVALEKALSDHAFAHLGGGDPMLAILAGFENCYPEKARAVGGVALRTLASSALTIADELGIRSDRHRGLLAAILFGFGHSALSDPLYPWIGGALRDSLVPNPEDRAARLFDRARTYLQHARKALA